MNPYYNKSTQQGLVDYYTYIAKETFLPIIIYNVPSRTGMNMLPETILEIHKEASSVCAVKEASGDISQITDLLSRKPDSFTVYSGNDDQTLPILSVGGKGVISVASNVIPAEMKSLTDAFLTGNVTKAQTINNQLIPLMKSLFIETNPSGENTQCLVWDAAKIGYEGPLFPFQKQLKIGFEKN